MEECPQCGRKFNERAYEKHIKICKDVFVKKRKVFNSKAHRLVDPEQTKLQKENSQAQALQSKQ